jgi:predicted solute-binding protein
VTVTIHVSWRRGVKSPVPMGRMVNRDLRVSKAHRVNRDLRVSKAHRVNRDLRVSKAHRDRLDRRGRKATRAIRVKFRVSGSMRHVHGRAALGGMLPHPKQSRFTCRNVGTVV